MLHTKGVLDFRHLPIVPFHGFQTDQQRFNVYRNRKVMSQLDPEERQKRRQRYSRDASAGATSSRIQGGVQPGPLLDALRGRGPIGWFCPDGTFVLSLPLLKMLMATPWPLGCCGGRASRCKCSS